MNTVSSAKKESKLVEIGLLSGGTLVRWQSHDHLTVFIVSANKTGGIGAVSLEDGTYLNPTVSVEVIPQGEVLTITAGGEQ